ncbi:2-hydroxyacid dehydrogenase [Nigerium massiliense]|uniref:2-hydroxyacid dehydrogenase n=1 Tax=Nigerium massiliense TaxID=1522317 RepID=UPI00058DFCF1|nr:2-hydroxyacid dehydrogenase [Nigerium massiliense]
MVKVLLAGDYFVTPEVLATALERHLPEAETSVLQGEFPEQPLSEDPEGVHESVGSEDDLIAALQGVDVCFTHTFPVTRKVMDACPDLRMVTVTRGGPVNADKQAATEHGVVVSFTPGRNATATTEHSLAMILAAVRQIAQRHEELRQGKWPGNLYRYDLVGPELAGGTVGLVGYGAIGSRVALVLQAMGMRVRVFDPYFKGELPEGMEAVDDLDDLLASANVLTLHARLTDDNKGMIGAREMALMPEGSVLVNCARGGLLDYDALCDALDSGHLYAAACDVLPAEPLPPDHRILHTDRLTVTPHLAGASKQAAELAADIGARDIAAFVHGERPQHVANPEVLDAE